MFTMINKINKMLARMTVDTSIWMTNLTVDAYGLINDEFRDLMKVSTDATAAPLTVYAEVEPFKTWTGLCLFDSLFYETMAQGYEAAGAAVFNHLLGEEMVIPDDASELVEEDAKIDQDIISIMDLLKASGFDREQEEQ